MIGTFIFLPIQTRESRLVGRFPVVAGGADVPIFEVESTRETYILVHKSFYDVGVSGILGSAVLSSRGNVQNSLINCGRRGNALTRGSMSTVVAGASTAASAISRCIGQSPLSVAERVLAEDGDGGRYDASLQSRLWAKSRHVFCGHLH